jgi:ankyrin repeat protein
MSKADFTKRARQAGLHRAARFGRTNSVRQLLDRGTDPNARDIHDTTPLHYAARNGHTEIVHLLLEAGAERSARSGPSGWTPLDLASTEEIHAILSAAAQRSNHAGRIAQERHDSKGDKESSR